MRKETRLLLLVVDLKRSRNRVDLAAVINATRSDTGYEGLHGLGLATVSQTTAQSDEQPLFPIPYAQSTKNSMNGVHPGKTRGLGLQCVSHAQKQNEVLNKPMNPYQSHIASFPLN